MRPWVSFAALTLTLLPALAPAKAKSKDRKEPSKSEAEASAAAAKEPADEAARPASSAEHAPPPDQAKPADSTGQETELNSPAMLGVGVTLSILGTAAVVVGTTWTYLRSENLPFVSFSPLVPIAGIGGGAALIAAGIPLWIAGAWGVPVEPETEKAAVRIEPILGLNGGGVRIRF